MLSSKFYYINLCVVDIIAAPERFQKKTRQNSRELLVVSIADRITTSGTVLLSKMTSGLDPINVNIPFTASSKVINQNGDLHLITRRDDVSLTVNRTSGTLLEDAIEKDVG